MNENKPPKHPFEPRLEFAFTVSIQLSKGLYLSPGNMGAERAAVYVESGEFEGPNIRGKVLPFSGGDWPLVRPDGVIDFDARYLLQADDGTLIYMQNRGYRWSSPEVLARLQRQEVVDPDEYYMRVSPKFDVPMGPHDWLDRHVFVGVAEKTPGSNRIHYFKVL
ncbi:DUF3237 family protein [Pseudomonas capeferrum]|uniref:DUF3237 family protein n=1 Tax=Pseudomonas capeferrum TaxID=1495066 RepID=UPI0015E312DB|nr:DUF3237 family protein [Pseudomonas capeferrum]MBA1204821.1 DUF3237 family protein [Pseudomonas capeferrum]